MTDAVLELRTDGVAATRSAGEALARVLRAGDVVVLAGDLGTGKTALAQGVARGLGVEERVASPTFVIVREYEGRLPLRHVDVYRLDHLQELHDLGFEEVLGPEVVTLVEWGDRVTEVLPAERLDVRLRYGTSEHERAVEVEGRGRRWEERRSELAGALDPWRERGGS